MDRNAQIREKGLVSTRLSSYDLWKKIRLHAYRIKLNSVERLKVFRERNVGKRVFNPFL